MQFFIYCECIIPGNEKLVQACLRAPPVVADEAKLAIVFTYFFLFSFFFFLCLLLFTHFGESPVRENLDQPLVPGVFISKLFCDDLGTVQLVSP